jgi:hypothetical protein
MHRIRRFAHATAVHTLKGMEETLEAEVPVDLSRVSRRRFFLQIACCRYSVVLFILIVSLLGSALLIITNAPMLFAELLLDGILSASLYRRLRGLDRSHWVETAFRSTALPFGVVAVILTLVGDLHRPVCCSLAVESRRIVRTFNAD